MDETLATLQKGLEPLLKHPAKAGHQQKSHGSKSGRVDDTLDTTDFKQVGGQAGSNPGGWINRVWSPVNTHRDQCSKTTKGAVCRSS